MECCKEVFPTVQMKGCLYHHTQCIWRKIQEIGLAVADRRDDGTKILCRRLIALAFLPSNSIKEQFNVLFRECKGHEKLTELFNYFRDTWIENPMWLPDVWSIHMMSIRTNNDVEGWHRKLNGHVHRGKLNMYLLCHLLFEESAEIDIP